MRRRAVKRDPRGRPDPPSDPEADLGKQGGVTEARDVMGVSPFGPGRERDEGAGAGEEAPEGDARFQRAGREDAGVDGAVRGREGADSRAEVGREGAVEEG